MKFSRGNILTLIILLAVVVGVCYAAWQINQNSKISKSDAMQALSQSEEVESYTDMQGQPAQLSDYVGQVLVVNSWASWSPNSAAELAELAKLATAYKEKGVKVIAINRAEPVTTAERFLRAIDQSEELILILDPTDDYYQSIGGYAMPETVFYDSAGNVVHHSRGDLDYESLVQYTELTLTAEESN